MRQLSWYERQTRTTPKELSATLPGLVTVTLALSRSLAPRVLDLVFIDVCRTPSRLEAGHNFQFLQKRT